MGPRPRRLPSGSYRQQVRNPLNERLTISITCPREEEVIAKVEVIRQLRRDLKFQLISPEEVAKRLATITGEAGPVVALKMREIWLEYVASFSPSRQRALDGTWDNHYRKRFDGKNVLDVTDEDWDAWEKDHANDSKGYIVTLHAMLRSAAQRQVKKGRIASFPWSTWRPSGRIGRDVAKREPLRSIEEVQLLLHEARAHDERLRGWGMYSDAFARVFVVVMCGLRQGEAAALGWDHCRDLQTANGPVMIVHVEFQTRAHWREDHPDWTRPRDEPKRKSQRTLRAHPTLRQVLVDHRAYLEAQGLYRRDGPVFPVPPKRGESVAEWRADEWVIKPELVRKFAAAAGIEIDLKRFDVHSLRHTMVTLELAATNNPVATAQRSGHRDLRVFFQYVHRAGRGLPDSPIPVFRAEPPRVVARALPAAQGDGDGARELPAAPDVDAITEDAAAEIEELRAGARDVVSVVGTSEDEHDLQHKLTDFEAAYRRWDAAGRKTKYPREVSERGKEAYSRAYNARMRSPKKGETIEERKKAAQLAGFRSKRAVLGAWGRLLARMGERADGAVPGPGLRDAPAVGAVVLPFRRKGQ